MANHRSAIKRHKQSEKRKLRNNAVKSEIKTVVKKVRANIAEGNKVEANVNLKAVTVLLDRAASKGVLHRNNASRKISRLSSAVHNSSK